MDLPQISFAATLITFFLGIAAAWMIGYRGKRLMKDFYLSSSFAANCRLLLLLVFGKTGRLDSYCFN